MRGQTLQTRMCEPLKYRELIEWASRRCFAKRLRCHAPVALLRTEVGAPKFVG